MSGTESHFDLVSTSLDTFLLSRDQNVLLIKGSWGSGKTYFLKSYLECAKKRKLLPKLLSYTSLFGCKDTDNIESRIIGNVNLPNLLRFESQNSWFSTLVAWISSVQIKAYGFSANLPVEAMLWRIAKRSRMLIILDDIERVSTSGTFLTRLLGLASALSENAQAKIILVCNEEKLPSEVSNQFSSLREKVIQREIKFSPSIHDTVNRMFPYKEERQDLIECLQQIAECNLRLVDRVSEVLSAIGELLERHHITIQHFQRVEALRASILFFKSPIPVTEELLWKKTDIWKSQSETAGQSPEDQFDDLKAKLGVGPSVIASLAIEWLSSGTFSSETVSSSIRDLKGTAKKAAYEQARQLSRLNLYSDFKEIGRENLIGSLKKLISDYPETISQRDFQRTVHLIEKLSGDTKDCWSNWLEANVEKWGPESLERYKTLVPFEELKAMAQEEIAKQAPKEHPKEIIWRIAERGSWREADLNTLISFDTQWYSNWLKEESAPDTFSTIRRLLRMWENSEENNTTKLIHNRIKTAIAPHPQDVIGVLRQVAVDEID